MYKSNGRTFCTDVKTKKLLPVRTCISRNDVKLKSATGLNFIANDHFIHSGVGASFVKSIEVKKGEYYYLLLDNVYSKGSGHTIQMHYEYPAPPIDLTVGASFTLQNIQFYAGQDVFLPTAYHALDSLLNLMKNNPKLKIEIQGHVNGPGQPNYPNLQQLSRSRAMAVYNFLVDNNIDATRMTTKAFGNTKMLFPNAFREEEATQNRRVEIKITEN